MSVSPGCLKASRRTGVVQEPTPTTRDGSSERTLAELQAEHGVHLGARHGEPRGELAEMSAVRNYVRDLVLGFNDGLVSVYAVTVGVAGAGFAAPQIFLTGVAASIAGALSMAAGEFISTKSQAQFYAAEREREQEHLKRWPHLEVLELRESLAEKGLEGETLERAVEAISSNREKFLDYMMKEEFGVGKESERSPAKAAFFVIIAFLVGSLFAFTPYWFLEPTNGLFVSTFMSLTGLFLAGVTRARASRLPAVTAGVEMMLIGAVAAAVTFVIGRAIGVAV